ncbi:hypothetical protein [Chryseobacterium sp. ISL-6]|uniref:hypothetical protein n=1 Tax=Chryseobacterium sp. ISL-6 TaxID=2819143 RepID=UPI001BE5E031|nr:hypothetical protein [Chryseobacterium sp. ISL-6]MBT2621846.1 hypothetical protein [Chryseobacterium sp. ISL-6]
MKENLQKKVSCFVAILTLLLLIFPTGLKAQESQNWMANTTTPYAFSASSGSFTYLTGGTGVSSIQVDTGFSGALPIGFSFKFGCKDYTQVYASSDGTLSFEGGSPYSSNNNEPLSWKRFLAPFWADLDGRLGKASYATSGTAPNRVFTMEWRDWKRYGSGFYDKNISFQVKLYEETNEIKYIYKQEFASGSPSGLSIGLFYGSDSSHKRWLNNASSSPTASSTQSSDLNRPATNQVYAFTPGDNNCTIVCSGRTTLNNSGGTKGTDGLRVIMTGAGNIQIVRNGTGQIYKSDDRLDSGTSSPYSVPGTTHGLILGIGGTQYTTGTLKASSGFTDGGRLTIVSNTCQEDTGPDADGIERNKIRLRATKNGRDYFLNVYYYYRSPETFMTVDYEVEIPVGNTELVKVAHGWDTYLNGGDSGPGFVTGQAPYYTMGVQKQGSYEAFQYVSGTPWSGYYSANYFALNSNLDNDLAYKNVINSNPNTDNGMGISLNFGKDSGTYNSINKVIFKCNAETRPVLRQTSVPCGSGSINLNSFVVPLNPNPHNLILMWRDSTGAEVANPTSVSKAGVYTVTYRDTVNSCDSPPSTFTITGVCVVTTCTKPASTATPTAFTKMGMSGYSSLQKDWPAKIPNGFIALESGFNGLVITRTVPGKITDPVAGMLIYDTSKNCFSLYNGTSWKCIEKSCND